MGGQLAVEVLRATALDGLGVRSRLVLLAMAVHALDRPKGDNPARVYWGGQRMLALEIYGTTDWGVNAGGRSSVRRAISDLSKRGLIRVYATSPHGRTAYEILPPPGGPNSPREGGPDSPGGGAL